MGLAGVELLMAIEDEFGIVISEADAEQLAIIGNMHDYVTRVLREGGEIVDEQQLWERLQGIVVRELGVRHEEVTRSAHIVFDLGAG